MARTNPNAKWQQLADGAAIERRPFEKHWLLNIAFYLGEQYTEWSDDIASIRHVPKPPRHANTPRPVANKLMHFASQAHAQALQTKPTVDVMPATDDMVDILTSGAGKAYLTWLAEPQVENFDGKLSAAVLWAVIAGSGYLKWYYDNEKGRPCISVPNPLDVFVDPWCSEFPEARYIFHRRFMDPEQVYDKWGIELDKSSISKADSARTQLMRSLGITSNLTGALVYELWLRPSRRFPKGGYKVWCGQQELQPFGDLPYDHKRLPFTQIGVIPVPGSAYYHSPLKFLRPGQMELNKYHAQRILIREGFANPKWFLDSELAASINALPDDTPRQVLIGDSQGGRLVPTILQPTGMADNNEGQWIVDEMQHIVGQHEVSQAQVPGRVEAAKAIELLKDADVSRLSELNRTIDLSISEGFWQGLMLAKQYVPAGQIVTTYSREGMPEVQRLKTENFKEGMRLRITRGGGLARSRAARQDQLLLLWQNGVIQDPQLMAELMELPIPTFISSKSFDIRLARSENFVLAKGTAITPNSWDDHQIHIQEHNNFRKTQEYLQLGNETKSKFEAHVQMHKTQWEGVLKDQIQMQMLQLQATGQVPPGGPGAPSPQDAAAQQGQTAFDLTRGTGSPPGTPHAAPAGG